MNKDYDPDIGKVENDLYIKNESHLKQRRAIHNNQFSVPRTWQHDAVAPTQKKPKKDVPVLLYFFLGACVFAALAFAVMSFSLIGQGRSVSNKNIDIDILGKGFAEGGEQIDLEVVISNRNAAPLELADLVLMYPKQGDTGTQSEEVRRSIDKIGGGNEHTEKYSVRLYGNENQTVQVKAKLEYRISGSKSIFEKEVLFPIVLRSSPLALTIKGADSIAPNQEAKFSLVVTSQSQESLQNVALRVEYPEGFDASSFSPNPDIGKFMWLLGDIQPGEEKIVDVSGMLKGEANQNLSLRAFVGQQDPKNEKSLNVLYASNAFPITLSQTFLTTRLSINGNGDDQVALAPGANIGGTIAIKNSSSTRVRDIEVVAELSGDLYEPNLVQAKSNGFYDSSKNRIIWNQATGSRASILDPGQVETLDFEIDAKTAPKGSMKIVISIKGIGLDGSVYNVKNIDAATITKASSISLIQEVQHDGGQLTNRGPVPPKANQETTYTISWKLPPQSADISNVVVTTTLASYVVWNNNFVPAGSDLKFDTATRTVTWKVPTLSAGSAGAATSFQIGFTPSLVQVGDVPELSGSVTVKGVDSITGSNLKTTRAGATTRLTNGSGDLAVVGQ